MNQGYTCRLPFSFLKAVNFKEDKSFELLLSRLLLRSLSGGTGPDPFTIGPVTKIIYNKIKLIRSYILFSNAYTVKNH